MSDHLQCRTCGQRLADVTAFHVHIRKQHGESAWEYYQRHREQLTSRILADVVKTDGPLDSQCWIFQGRPIGHGYRTARVAGAPTARVHKLSYFAHHGTMPDPDEVLRHRCDRPACCNPDHLITGTQLENVKDAYDRGRYLSEFDHPASTVTVEQVHSIRQHRVWGWTYRAIAATHDVGTTTVRRVVQGKAYSSVIPRDYGESIPF